MASPARPGSRPGARQMPKQSRADATDEDPGREGGVQAVHDPDPVQRLQPRGMGVDRDVQKAGADPDDGENEDEHRNGVRKPGSHSTAPKNTRKIGTSRAPKTSASVPTPASPAELRARRTATRARAARRSLPSRAGSQAGTQPTSPSRARRPRRPRQGPSLYSGLQIPLDEIVLLQAPQPFADLACANSADAGDRLEISLGRTDDRIQVARGSPPPS